MPLEVDSHSHDVSQQTDADPSVLAVVAASVKVGDHRMVEHLDDIGEVDAMLLDILVVLPVIPLELHAISVYTRCIDVNGSFPVPTPPLTCLFYPARDLKGVSQRKGVKKGSAKETCCYASLFPLLLLLFLHASMERGWIHGAQEFRDQMSDWLEERQQGAEKSSDADQKRDLTERAVKQRIKEGCRFLHIPIDQLKKMRKGDENKVLLAAYIKEHYSLSNQRISELLHMGHPTFISKCGGTVQHDRRLRKKYQHLKGKLSHG